MIRIFTWRNSLFTALAVGLSAASSGAHANSSLCFTEGHSPGDNQGYETVCGNSEANYADLTVTPTGDAGGVITIHITDHFVCEGDTHLECSLSTNLFNNICMTEGQYNSGYRGDVPELFVQCSCYSPDDPCETVE